MKCCILRDIIWVLRCLPKTPLGVFFLVYKGLTSDLQIRVYNILSVNEKLPVSKFRYFGKYIIQLFGYCYVNVSGQRHAGLER